MCSSDLKPFDRRALLWVAPAVAEAAMKTKVARKQIDLRQYKDRLETLLGSTYTVMRGIKKRVQTDGSRATLVLPEGENSKILRAAQIMREEGIAEPILLGSEEIVHARIRDLGLEKELKDARDSSPSRLVWFSIGGATGVAVTVLTTIAVVQLTK